MPSTDSRVALITGASQGLGRTLARFLALQGYHLILDARRQPTLDEAAGELRTFGVKVEAIAGDVADKTHRQDLIAATQVMGRLDLLVNNASTLGPLPMPAMHQIPVAELHAVFAVNFFAPVALMQGLLPWLKQSQGLIVNVSSDAALGGYAGWGGYGASKAALDLVSRTLANELRGEGVAVVSVDPGDMRTDMHQAAFPGQDISDRPLPDVTLPFWAWLLGQEPHKLSGKRFLAQAESWVVEA